MARKVLLLFAFAIVAPALGADTASKPTTGSALGVGTVFLSNPVADLGHQTLTDRKDADYAALSPAYHDAEVILHEYGHAIHFSQGFVFGSAEAAAISEGFGDYWAVTVSSVVTPTPDPACVADWDAISYTSLVPHCLRRVDRNLHYPEDLNGEVHHDGQIWSRALWDIRQAVGHVKADTLILEAQFGFPGTTMRDLAARTVAVAANLYGRAVATQVRAAFVNRGLL